MAQPKPISYFLLVRFALMSLALAACSSYREAEPAASPDASTEPSKEAGTSDDAAAPVVDAGSDADANPDAGVDSGACIGVAECERIVFVTSTKEQGALGGATVADAKCQQLADVGSKTAGRTFKAWLSLTGTPAKSRVTNGTRAYRRTDGATVRDNFADIVAGTGQLFVPINHDENGVVVPATDPVWTGTNDKGEPVGGRCGEWVNNPGGVGRTGLAGALDAKWTNDGDIGCQNMARLYCFED